ncbi:MAG: YfhO family protein [Xanthomonadales bacterium]|nr:YfhO family protein [Xanthomonadales bacterium]
MNNNSPEESAKDYWTIALLLLLIILFFVPGWLGDRNFMSDGQYGAYAANMSPWSNAWIGGWPAVADTAAFLWYPVRILFASLGAGFDAFVVSAYLIAASGAYFYLRVAGIQSTGALIGGAGFALSGFMIAHQGHTSMIHVAAWIPWMFAGVEGVLSSGRRRWAFVAAASVAMACLAGHAQIFFYGCFFVALYMLFRFPEMLRKKRLRHWVVAGTALASGIMIVLPQLLLTWGYLAETPRSEMDYLGFVSYSLPLRQLPTVLFPFLFGGDGGPFGTAYFGEWNFTEMCAYMPFALLVLAIPAVLVRGSSISFYWAFVAGCGIMLALGGTIPILAEVTYRLPGFNLFRVPARHSMEFCLAVSILAGIGFDRVAQATERMRWLVCALAVAATILVIIMLLPAQVAVSIAAKEASITLPTSWIPTSTLLGIGGVLTGLMALVLAVVVPRFASLAIVSAMAFGCVAFAMFAEWRMRDRYESSLLPTPVEAEIGRLLAAESGRVISQNGVFSSVLGPDRVRLQGISSANWYGPLIPKRAAEVLNVAPWGSVSPETFGSASSALDIYAVRFAVIDPGIVAKDNEDRARMGLNGSRWEEFASDGSATIYRNLRALPMVWLTNRWIESPPEATLSKLHNSSGFEPRQEALVEGLASGGSDRPAGNVKSIVWNTGSILTAEVESSDDGFLVFSVNHMPGWKALVDDVAKPIYRTDYSLIGLPVEKGTHRVKIEYRISPGAWFPQLAGGLQACC